MKVLPRSSSADAFPLRVASERRLISRATSLKFFLSTFRICTPVTRLQMYGDEDEVESFIGGAKREGVGHALVVIMIGTIVGEEPVRQVAGPPW